MIRPGTLVARPSITLAFLGGAVAAILLSALLYVAPAAGLPLVDVPVALGGIFSAQAGVALALGYFLFYLGGALLGPFLFVLSWPHLPGPDVGLLGGAVKGLVWGVAMWLLTGLALGLAGLLNQQPAGAFTSPGFFALSSGLVAAVLLLVAHLLYGLALGVITAMGYDIEPIDTLGWDGYHQATRPDVIMQPNGHRRERQQT